MIGDFSGNTLPKPDRRVLILAKGPSLAAFGVQGTISNPHLDLYDGNTLVDSNESWQTIDDDSGDHNALEEKLTENGFAPAQDVESVLWPTFPAPAIRTILLSSSDGSTGIGQIEFYEY